MQHYIFFGAEREHIHDPAFLRAKGVAGAQLRYSWRELEPERDGYALDLIRADQQWLQAHNKKLWVQLQDVTFAPAFVPVPPYLRQDTRYHGGANRQYEISGGDEKHAAPAGWVARRWDSAVQARLHRLFAALGRAFDGTLAGINLAETSVEFGETGVLFPPDFTPARYADAIVANMAALKRAFPQSVAMQYANFMPGEWLPGNDHHLLRTIYDRARALHVAVAGPDLLPYKRGQMAHSYPLLRASHGLVPTGIAVQEGNYAARNSRTGKPVTLPELLAFATDYLRVGYIFWCNEEPYYRRDVLPFLATLG